MLTFACEGLCSDMVALDPDFHQAVPHQSPQGLHFLSSFFIYLLAHYFCILGNKILGFKKVQKIILNPYTYQTYQIMKHLFHLKLIHSSPSNLSLWLVSVNVFVVVQYMYKSPGVIKFLLHMFQSLYIDFLFVFWKFVFLIQHLSSSIFNTLSFIQLLFFEVLATSSSMASNFQPPYLYLQSARIISICLHAYILTCEDSRVHFFR